MSKLGSVAPKERINIVYQPSTNGNEEVELPFKILAIGDYTGRADDRCVEDRTPINIDKDNFNEVMASHKLAASFCVENSIHHNGGDLTVDLKFDTLKDFTPEGIAAQVPELRELMELRDALTALKGPLGNMPGFRSQLRDLLADASSRQQLTQESAALPSAFTTDSDQESE